MLELPDSWVWDSWLADDGERFHLFFLFASRALLDPERRHARAAIGHAVSDDLRHWTRVSDALVSAPAPAFDDLATWTGSVVRAPDGGWLLFYTGVTLGTGGRLRQSIGLATSDDLLSWHRHPGNPIVEAEPRWYEHHDDPGSDEAWRDPWVFPDPDGDGWHMLLTARANHGPDDEHGVIGHATSPDLYTWTVQPPISCPGKGFSQLEVPQLAAVDGASVLIFSCLPDSYKPGRTAATHPVGIWALPLRTRPFTLPGAGLDVRNAAPLTDDTLYAGHLVHDRGGATVLIAFRNESDRGFVGAISDPLPVRWSPDGSLTLAEGPAGH